MARFRIAARAGRLSFFIGSSELSIGASVDADAKEALGFKDHAKTLNERFFSLLVLLALARKEPDQVRQRLQLPVTDDGYLPLSAIRRLGPMGGPSSAETMRHNITNNFQIGQAEGNTKPPALRIRRGPRGRADEDQLQLTYQPEEISIASDAANLLWQRLDQWLAESDPRDLPLSGRGETDPLPPQCILEPGIDRERPFRPGRPTGHPRLFFGRTDYLRSLFSNWHRAPLQNTAILGSRLSGKTSLMRHLVHLSHGQELQQEQRRDWHPPASRIKFVYIDFEDVLMRRERSLIRSLLKQMGLPMPEVCDLEGFMQIVATKLQQPTLVLLDHIGAVFEGYRGQKEDYDLGDPFWQSLRALTCNYTKGDLAFALSVNEFPQALAQRHNRSSSFFTMFQMLNLGPLEDAEARALVASSPLSFPQEDLDWIWEKTRCWPRLLQIVCDRRLTALRNNPKDNSNWKELAIRDLAPWLRLLESEEAKHGC